MKIQKIAIDDIDETGPIQDMPSLNKYYIERTAAYTDTFIVAAPSPEAAIKQAMEGKGKHIEPSHEHQYDMNWKIIRRQI